MPSVRAMNKWCLVICSAFGGHETCRKKKKTFKWIFSLWTLMCVCVCVKCSNAIVLVTDGIDKRKDKRMECHGNVFEMQIHFLATTIIHLYLLYLVLGAFCFFSFNCRWAWLAPELLTFNEMQMTNVEIEWFPSTHLKPTTNYVMSVFFFFVFLFFF